VDLYSQGLNIVCSVSSSCEVEKIELDLVPSVVQSHRHGADERLYPCSRLVVGRSESSLDIFIVQHRHFERKVFLQILYDHDQEWQFDSKRLSRLRVIRALNIGGTHVRAYYLQYEGLDIVVSNPLDVSIANFLVPDLQGLAADAIQDG